MQARRVTVWLLILAAICLAAEAVEFSARVHAQRIGLDDTLQFTLTLSGVDNPEPPDIGSIRDFTVQSRSRSTEFRMVNGRTSHLTRFEFRLAPRRTGTLTIPALRYAAAGRTLVTSPIQVEVVSGSVAPPPRRRSLFDDDLFSFPRQRREQQEPVDVRLAVDISPRTAVPGQQVMVNVRLLTRNTVRAVNLLSEPAISGFWQEWFPVPRSSAGRTREVDGKTYTEYDIRRVALFPNQTGRLNLPAFKFEIVLAQEGLGFFTEPRRITRTTEPQFIEVSPLPEAAAGLPVGDFSLRLEPFPEQAKTHDMVTLKLRITGNGNMKTLGIPEVAGGPFFQAFPPKVERDFDYSGQWLRGTVSAEIPITFRRGGTISLPPVKLSWWDPGLKRIKSVESAPLTIAVTETAGADVVAPETGADVVRRGRDIHHIHGGSLSDQSRHWHHSGAYPWLLLLPFMVSLAMGLYRGIWQPLVSRSRRLEARRVFSRALRDLRAVSDLGAAAGIVERYLNERTGLAPSRMNAATIARSLEDHGVGEREIREFLAIKERIDSTRYAPGSGGAGDRETLERLRALLRRIDGKIA